MLLLDEPSSALDPRQRERLWEFLLALEEQGTAVVYSTHDVQEAERHAHRVVVLADGELLFAGLAARARASWSGAHGPRLRGRVRRVPAPAGPLMRWLLVKDLQILRRSPLLLALLVIYPIVIAVLIGFALSRGPDKPRVAFLNLVPPAQSELELGGEDDRPVGLRGHAVREHRPGPDRLRGPRPGGVRGGGARQGARRRRPGRARDPGGHHAAAAGAAEPPGGGAADGEGVLQRRGPGQGALRRGHDQVAGAGRERGADQEADRGRAELPGPDRRGRRDLAAAPRRRHRGARPGALERDRAGGAGAAAAELRGAQAARPGDPLQRARAGEPRPLRRGPEHDRHTDQGRDRDARRRHDAAVVVRRGGRGRDLADVRDGPAGGRHARARARGERLPPARARARLARPACSRRRRCSPPRARSVVGRPDAVRAGALRRPRLGPLPALGRGRRRGLARVRRARAGRRRARARGARRVAARVHARRCRSRSSRSCRRARSRPRSTT